MPKVHFGSEGNETHEVDDDLYMWFLDEVLIEEKSIEETINSIIDPEHQRTLNNYIIYRLAEVDPGYVMTKERLIGDNTHSE
jgi:hypothetical protein